MAYTLSQNYQGQGLLDGFSFFTGKDPSHGFVQYQGQADALAQGLVSVDDDASRVRLRVDTTNIYTVDDDGRPSVRLTSYEGWTHGLFIADFAHMPSSSCGVWPAFKLELTARIVWAFNNAEDGTNWPLGGELDIVEGANTAARNFYSAHTVAGCELPSTGFTGEQANTDCGPSPDNIGCNYASPLSDSAAYGDSFNAEGGGVYALEWDLDGLRIWHFPRSDMPADIELAPAVAPKPEAWGPPQAVFGGDKCNADSFFFNMSLVINITGRSKNLCGDYAANVWGVRDECTNLAPTCNEWVAGNPEAFQGAYWDINYINVYQKQGDTISNSTIGNGNGNGTAIPTGGSAQPTGLPANLTFPTGTPDNSSSLSPTIPTGGPGPEDTPSSAAGGTRTVTLMTVTASSIPTASGGGLRGPGGIGDYTLLGCFGSRSGYPNWSPVADLPNMDNEACVASCEGLKYAGVYDTTCYCADTITDASAVANGECDKPCPGNQRQACGGLVDIGAGGGGMGSNGTFNSTVMGSSTLMSRYHRRAAPSDIIFTVYGNLTDAAVPVPAPGMGGGDDGESDPATTTSAPPTSTMGNTTITTEVTVTYTTVCPTNPAILMVSEYCTTLTIEECGCTKTPGPSNSSAVIPTPPAAIADIPMATCTETCDACGPNGESTVTLTVPSAVMIATATATGVEEGDITVVVTAISVATVVPVSNAVMVNSTYSNNTTSNSTYAAAVASQIAMMAGTSGSGVGSALGWAVAMWLGVFGVMITL